jgi:hypothetical protein
MLGQGARYAMSRRRISKVVLLTIAWALAGPTVFLSAAIGITSSGTWSVSIGEANLSGGAGTNLAPTYDSATNQLTINVTGTKNKNDAWRIDVRSVNTSWNANLYLNVLRTSNGTGPGSISGGTSYIQLTTSNQTFFSGKGDRTGITVQLRLSNLSVKIPPATDSAYARFTIVDT